MNDSGHIELMETKLQRGEPYGLRELRKKRIEQALSFRAGSHEHPEKHIINTLKDGTEVYFEKPGKEAQRNKPNEHDMRPLVGAGKEKLSFTDIWGYLVKVAINDEDVLKKISLLIYRIGYMQDHAEDKSGIIRYTPSVELERCIEEIDSRIGSIYPFWGLLGFLNFIDILGWNEDVKYHTENGLPTFSGKHGFRVGRINTALSCISVPFITLEYINYVILHAANISKLDSKEILDVMQRLSRSRGVCPATQSELVRWLSPYLSK